MPDMGEIAQERQPDTPGGFPAAGGVRLRRNTDQPQDSFIAFLALAGGAGAATWPASLLSLAPAAARYRLQSRPRAG